MIPRGFLCKSLFIFYSLARHRSDGLVIILGERYWVYPQVFTEFLVRHMVDHVSGVPDREVAEDKLRGYFNETRKRSKREQLVIWFSLRFPLLCREAVPPLFIGMVQGRGQ